MKCFKLLGGLLAVALSFTAGAANYETVKLGKHQAVATRVLARFKSTADAGARARALADQKVSVSRSYSLVEDLVVLEFAPTPRLNTVVVPPPDPEVEGKKLMARIKSLMLTGVFAYVEPDYLFSATLTPTDAAYVDGTLWGMDDIGGPAAWDITTGSTDVVVAVIDSGVNYRHQDLAGQMWVNPDEIAGNGLDDDNDGFIDNIHGIDAITNSGDPMDDNEHGSHVAGTIGGSANDAGRIVGVAWKVRIMACKFLDNNGSGSLDDAIQCIDFARQNGAKIMNNSWGGGPYTQSLFDAIQATRNAGMLFVAAAGNESNNNDASPAYPASYNIDNVLSVAAVDVNHNIAGFSNYGAQTVHLGAPGVGIYSSIHTSPTAYATLNGTSMASPHVAGAAALLWAQLQPTTVAQVAELRQRLLLGVEPTSSLTGKTVTGGRLNIANSLGVSPDNILELAVTSDTGLNVIAGRTVGFFVRVKDLFPVNNATVTGTLSFNGATVPFANGGVAPDVTAGDNIYSAAITVPPSLAPFTVTVNVTAPGKTAATLPVQFTVISAPSNDSFAGREPITSTPAIVTGSTLNATKENFEPVHAGAAGGKSLWWTWTAPASGVYSLSTDGSSFDTVLGVYTGNSLTALSPVGANDDAGFDWTSTVVFSAAAGTPYQFAVDGFSNPQDNTTDAGGVQLNFSPNSPMLNDNFANRTPVTGINVSVTGHNVGSTAQTGEPDHGGYAAETSVWWTWTAPSSGSVTISTAGSSFDTLLAIYAGSALGSLLPIASNDDVAVGTLTSEVTFLAQAGVAYQIAVDGFGVGNVQLHIGRAPANDSFAARIALPGADLVEAQGMSLGASFESGEPSPVGNVPGFGRSVWWTWTAPRDGKVTITTDGSNFDTAMGVYTGTSVGGLALVAENDDRVFVKIRTSLVSFGAVAGRSYHIQVDGFSGLAGRVQLTLMMDGRSRLSLPEVRPEGTVVGLLGEPDRIYVLKASSDLGTWTGVKTNTVVSRRVIFQDLPQVPGGNRFYRAEPASLLGGE